MVRENLSLDTSFEAFNYLQRKHSFQLFGHSAPFEMERRKNKIFLLNQVGTIIHLTGWSF